MVFRRFQPSLHPVRSIKHVVDTSGAITGATATITDVVDVVADPPDGTSNACASGSTIHGIFLNVQVTPVIAAGGVDRIYMMVYKNNGANTTPPAVDAVGVSDNRRWVIHQEMLMLQSGITDNSLIPRTLFKGVIKFPRNYKRNGIDDKWQVIIGHATGEVTQKSNWCIECIYKEFR